MHRTGLAGCLVLATISLTVAAQAQVTLETTRMRLVIGEDANWRSVLDRASNRECLAEGVALPVAKVTIGANSFSASGASYDGKRLSLRFARTDTVLTYEVSTAADCPVLRLMQISGTRPQTVTLLQLPCCPTDQIGTRLDCAWDDRTAVALLSASQQTDCSATGGKHALLRAFSQDAPGPKLEGAAVAVVVCPTSDFKRVARDLSHACGLLTNEDADGTPVKDLAVTRGSYWFLTFGESEVDQVVDYCERSGIKQVMIASGSWCRSVGHYLFNETRYPHGKQGLKAVVDKLHAHGILVGMHCFVSKVSKIDPYVTPVPDRRFWKDRQTTLAADVTADQTTIAVKDDLSQWPGSPVSKQKTWEGGVAKHQEVILGDEVVQYESIDPSGSRFLGCKRGAWGTKASAHRTSEAAVHYGVDGCINGYIIDQETTLMAEVADRIAGIFNDCGFDMVYFDGGEDVNTLRFNYFSANFQEQAMRRFTRRPLIHMGTVRPHTLWHSYARAATVDTYLNTIHGNILAGVPLDRWPTVRDHIDKSVRQVEAWRKDMMPGELGWFGIWPREANTDGLQLDEVEYLLCKSLALDAPVSLETSFSQMESHPLTPEILRLVREYERLRLTGSVPQGTRTKLAETGKDFALIEEPGKVSFASVKPLKLTGPLQELRACVGTLGTGSVATVWHPLREGQLAIPLEASEVTATNLTGQRLAVTAHKGSTSVPVGCFRTTLLCAGLSPDQLRQALEASELQVKPPTLIFVQAEDYKRLEGSMALGSKVGVREPEAFGDVIVCTGQQSRETTQPWYVEYTVQIPQEGRWTLWARVRYPSGIDDSFGILTPQEQVTLGSAQTLGNCGANDKKWHWTGRGAGTTTPPPGQPVTFRLPQGPFTFRLYAREGPGTAVSNPRLDMLCLTDDPGVVPTEEAARKWLETSGKPRGSGHPLESRWLAPAGLPAP